MADPAAEGRSGGISRAFASGSKSRLWSGFLSKKSSTDSKKKSTDERFQQALAERQLERGSSDASNNTTRSNRSHHSLRRNPSHASSGSHTSTHSRNSTRERTGDAERGSDVEGKSKRTPKKLQKRRVPKPIQKRRGEIDPSENSPLNTVHRTTSTASDESASSASSLVRRRADPGNGASTSRLSLHSASSRVPSPLVASAEASRSSLPSPSRVHFVGVPDVPKGSSRQKKDRPSRKPDFRRLLSRGRHDKEKTHESSRGGVLESHKGKVPESLEEQVKKARALVERIKQLEKKFSLPPRREWSNIELHGIRSRRSSRDSGVKTEEEKQDRHDRRIERVRIFLLKLRDWLEPLTLDAALIAFRSTRLGDSVIGPVGNLIASCSGALHYVLDALQKVRINKELCDLQLDSCIDELETVTYFIKTGSAESERTMKLLEEYAKTIAEHCQKVYETVDEYKRLNFFERFIKREKLNEDIKLQGSLVPLKTKEMQMFILIRSLAITVEERSQRERNHQEVMTVLQEMSREIIGLKKAVIALIDGISKGAMQEDAMKVLDEARSILIDNETELEHLVNHYKKEADRVVLEREQEEKRDIFKKELKDITERLSQLDQNKDHIILKVLEIRTSEIPNALKELKEESVRTEERIRVVKSQMKEENLRKTLELENELLSKRKEFADKAVRMLNEELEGRGKHTLSVAPSEKMAESLSRTGSPSSSAANSRRTSVVDAKHMPLIEEEDVLYMKPNRKSRPSSPTTPMHSHEVGTTQYDSGRSTPEERVLYKNAEVQTIEKELARRRHLKDFLPERVRGPADPEERNARKFALTLVHEYSTQLEFPLWSPTTCELGDVGMIDVHGSFVKFFNASEIPHAIQHAVRPMREVKQVGGRAERRHLMRTWTKRTRMLRIFEESDELAEAVGSIRGEIKRWKKMPTHYRDDVSFMYLQHPRYYHFDDSKLHTARHWFREHEEAIFDYYAKRNEYLQKNNLVMVAGKLEAQNYAYLINHKRCRDEIRFYVFARAVKGEKWGDFARFEKKRVKDGVVEHITNSPRPDESTCRVSRVRADGAHAQSVMLQCIRMTI